VIEEGRYNASEMTEAQFEEGSNGTVLKNLRGIIAVDQMDRAEAVALALTTEQLVSTYDGEHRFTAADLRAMHQRWLGGLYSWAGEYRHVNVSKGGFPFSAASRIPALMEEFEAGPLRMHTPCSPKGIASVAKALAETHVEFVLIHPFRDGNGRLSRLLAVLMALQAGLPFLDFSVVASERRADYFAAVQAGMNRNYAPMSALFAEIIRRTIERVSDSAAPARAVFSQSLQAFRRSQSLSNSRHL